MELSDEQVLAQLKLRRVRLKLELEKVNIAIRAFEDEDEKNLDFLEAAPYLIEEMSPDNDEMAIATLMYNPRSSYQKKVMFVLSKLGEGDASDITQYLLRIDKKIKDHKALHERITYVASRMFNLNEITAHKVGKRNVYRLKSETKS